MNMIDISELTPHLTLELYLARQWHSNPLRCGRDEAIGHQRSRYASRDQWCGVTFV